MAVMGFMGEWMGMALAMSILGADLFSCGSPLGGAKWRPAPQLPLGAGGQENPHHFTFIRLSSSSSFSSMT
jgi:hypothetical protein